MCFIVRDAHEQALGYFYFDEDPHRRAVNKRLTKDEAPTTTTLGVSGRKRVLPRSPPPPPGTSSITTARPP